MHDSVISHTLIAFVNTDPGNLSIELSLRYHMSDACTKFEEDWTKFVVAIVDKRFVRTHRQTDIHTLK